MTAYAETVVTDVEVPLPPEPDWLDDERKPATPRAAALDLSGPIVDGAQFILDQPPEVAAIWGEGSRVLWAAGESLMIAGPQGLGKTTLAGQLIKALLGLETEVLGLPVAKFSGRVLYLAMDRPRQIARSLRRQFAERDRDRLAAQLVVRAGPPPADLAAQPDLLAAMAQHYRASVVFVDSLKDAAVGLTDDAVAASYNRARQRTLAAGCQVAELHHTVKRGPGGAAPNSVADIYGSVWLTSGSGSVVLLSGEPGDPIVGMRHVKQPAEEVGPYRLLHDQTAGRLTIEHSVDLAALVATGGVHGLTARQAAVAISEKAQPSRADVEKARRRLDALVAAAVLTRVDASNGAGEQRTATAYFTALN